VVGLVAAWVKGLEPRCHDDRTHIEADGLLPVVELDGLGGAKLFACPTFSLLEIDAMVLVDDVLKRYGLCIGNVGGLPGDKPLIVFVIHTPRALFGARPAGDALLGIYESRLFEDLQLEIPSLASDGRDLGKGQKLDVEMPADLDQLGRDDSHGAVVGGKGLVQLRHDSADGGGPFHEINVVARVCQVKRRLHAGDAAADHTDRSYG
jgi:hypothetical protein